jgi:hypothetical protein
MMETSILKCIIKRKKNSNPKLSTVYIIFVKQTGESFETFSFQTIDPAN